VRCGSLFLCASIGLLRCELLLCAAIFGRKGVRAGRLLVVVNEAALFLSS
jgi:hypothetical protein